MAKIMASKLQVRVLELLGKDFDGSYDMAARLLEAMGLPKNGAPEGHTARSANKLSNEELLALLPKADTNVQQVETEAERKQREAREAYERKQQAYARAMEREAARQERRRLNDALRANGYRWVKLDDEGREAYGYAPWDEWDKDRWALFGPDGKEVTVEAAKAAIGWK